MAITYRPDDPPKGQNSWMEEEPPTYEMGTKDYQIPQGNLDYTNPLLQKFQEQPAGFQRITRADLFRQKYGSRADELMNTLNANRKKGEQIDWNEPITLSIQNEPVNVNGQKVDLGAGGRYVKNENTIYMGPRYVNPEAFKPAYKDEWASTLSHETVHTQQPAWHMQKRLPKGYTTTHLRDPDRFDEAVAQIMGNELNAYNLRQSDEKKFHPAMYRNAAGELDYNAGMDEFYKIIRSNPDIFVNANRMLGKDNLGAFDPKTKGNLVKEWESATKTIGANRVIATPNSYQIRPDSEVA